MSARRSSHEPYPPQGGVPQLLGGALLLILFYIFLSYPRWTQERQLLVRFFMALGAGLLARHLGPARARGRIAGLTIALAGGAAVFLLTALLFPGGATGPETAGTASLALVNGRVWSDSVEATPTLTIEGSYDGELPSLRARKLGSQEWLALAPARQTGPGRWMLAFTLDAEAGQLCAYEIALDRGMERKVVTIRSPLLQVELASRDGPKAAISGKVHNAPPDSFVQVWRAAPEMQDLGRIPVHAGAWGSVFETRGRNQTPSTAQFHLAIVQGDHSFPFVELPPPGAISVLVPVPAPAVTISRIDGHPAASGCAVPGFSTFRVSGGSTNALEDDLVRVMAIGYDKAWNETGRWHSAEARIRNSRWDADVGVGAGARFRIVAVFGGADPGPEVGSSNKGTLCTTDPLRGNS